MTEAGVGDIDTLIDRARSLRSTLRERAPACEEARRVTEEFSYSSGLSERTARTWWEYCLPSSTTSPMPKSTIHAWWEGVRWR